MIMNSSIKVAVKCSECGKYVSFYINLFETKQPTSKRCSCGNVVFKAHLNKGEVDIKIPCIACGEEHIYRYKMKDLMDRYINILGCYNCGMEIAFLGKEYLVDDMIKKYMDDMLELLSSFGVIENKGRMEIKKGVMK